MHRPARLATSIRRISAVTVVALAAVAVGAAELVIPQQAKATLAEAADALQRGQLAEAESLYKKARRQIGRRVFETEEGRARALHSRGELEPALNAAKKALELSRTPVHRAVAWNRIGALHTAIAIDQTLRWSQPAGTTAEPSTERLERAEAALLESVDESAGAFHLAWYNLAEVRYLSGRLEEAQQAMERYAATAPPGQWPRRARDLSSCLETLLGPHEIWSFDELREAGGVLPKNVASTVAKFSDAARRNGTTGDVLIAITINTVGDVVCPRVLSGLPDGLGHSAFAAVRDFRYEPGRLDGEAVPVSTRITVSFGVR